MAFFTRTIEIGGKQITVKVDTDMQTVTPVNDEQELTPEQIKAISARPDDAVSKDGQPF